MDPRTRPAFCPVCRGVLPFTELPRRHPLARARFRCGRCGTPHRRDDPGGRRRRAALRWFIYGALAGLGAAAAATAMATAPGPPDPAWGDVLAALGLAALCAGCTARSAWLGLLSAEYGRLTPMEREVLARRLCPGMIRSDVVDDLSARGWTIAKIRTALASLRPAS